MGMSSSQARLLTLTGRMHDIEYKAAKLEAQKLQMANESAHVYQEYLNALEATKIQYQTVGNDGSIKYNDASYFDICFGNTPVQYGLFSTANGHMYVPQEVADAYAANPASAANFATALSGFVPTVVPTNPVTPTPTPTPGTSPTYTPPSDETVPDGNNITLSRGQSKSTTVNGPITLTLTNPIGGSNYTYSVDSASSSNVTFQYLLNGRLIVSGDNLTITASNRQTDDIILLGSGNTVNTGDYDDIVRVGLVYDSEFTYMDDNANNNTINTGTGKDHLAMNGSGNKIIDSDSNTSVLYYTKSVESATNTTQSANQKRAYFWQYTSTNAIDTSTGASTTEGFASQGNSNDCRLYSLINSIGRNSNSGNLSSYVDITDNGSNYKVTFKNYNKGGQNYWNVPKSDMNNYNRSTGDLTTALVDYALNQLMWQNRNIDGDDDIKAYGSASTAFAKARYRTISEYFFGNDNFAMYFDENCSGTADMVNKFLNTWDKYQSGTDNVTNLLVGFNTTCDGLSIISGHAYSVKNVAKNPDNSLKYVELVNPWDDGDILRLDSATFVNNLAHFYVFGSNLNTPGIFCNADSSISDIETININDSSNDVLIHQGAISEDEQWTYFFNMHHAITQAGGCEIVPADMVYNSDYLVNMINGGFAYLKNFDKHENKWVDTSVATNTGLREVECEKELKKAEAKYEADMKKIDRKDRRYDEELSKLDNERNALKSEMETLKTVAKENVERTFKLFS